MDKNQSPNVKGILVFLLLIILVIDVPATIATNINAINIIAAKNNCAILIIINLIYYNLL